MASATHGRNKDGNSKREPNQEPDRDQKLVARAQHERTDDSGRTELLCGETKEGTKKIEQKTEERAFGLRRKTRLELMNQKP
jgi:hypothetical protein